MPKTSLAAPVPPPTSSTVASTAALMKQVNIRGLCTRARIDEENDPWFPASEVPAAMEKSARTACAGCPVLAECRELTLRQESRLSAGHIHGIFGGLAPHERIALIRARRGGETR